MCKSEANILEEGSITMPGNIVSVHLLPGSTRDTGFCLVATNTLVSS